MTCSTVVLQSVQCYGSIFNFFGYGRQAIAMEQGKIRSCTDLKESHDADDAKELEDIVFLLEVGEYEVEVERDGGDEVDEVDGLAHKRQLVGTDDKPYYQLERKPTVTHALDEEERLVRLRLPLVQHPRVPRQVGGR